MIKHLFTRLKLRALERQRATVWEAFQSTYAAREEDAQARHRQVEPIRKERTDRLHAAMGLHNG
jgi:hypothetical protein